MNFFYGNEPDMFTFFKIPKLLFSEPYRDVSTDAKLLFGLMLDRMALSSKSQNWIDPDGRVYIYFAVDEVMETLNVGKNKALNLYKELETRELIQRERQPFGKPAKIYVRKFFNAAQKQRGGENQTSTGLENKPLWFENQTSTGLENKPLWFENQTSTGLENKPLPYNKTDNNKTDNNKTEDVSTRKVSSTNQGGIMPKGFCAEPPTAPHAPHVPVEPVGGCVAFLIPLNDGTDFPVTADMVRHWAGLYPAVNVEQELRNMIGWCEANPKKRKTNSGVTRFITGWLSKAQNQSGAFRGNSPQARGNSPQARKTWTELLEDMQQEGRI